MPHRKPRILIIDDDEGFCRLLSKHLERSDFEVVCAHSGESGLQRAAEDAIDAIVLDHALPEYDGLSLLSMIERRKNAPPIVYLTASQDSRVAVAALKAGASDYVVKDVHGEFLLLLENAVTNAMFASAIRRDKEKAETDVRAARDQFKALAEDRALLLKEVSHRVSNSLQLIASLLHFQGDVSGNPDVKAALKEANGRVLAVSRVHRSLYTSFDVRWVSLSEYLSSLFHDLEDVTSSSAGQESAITFNADAIQAGPDKAVAVGIVATELVLNALKHAYPNGQGPIRVKLRAKPDAIELSVEDEGIGVVDDPNRHRGLGQRIMAGMAEKLDGSLIYEDKPFGTRAVLKFPIADDVRTVAAPEVSPATSDSGATMHREAIPE